MNQRTDNPALESLELFRSVAQEHVRKVEEAGYNTAASSLASACNATMKQLHAEIRRLYQVEQNYQELLRQQEQTAEAEAE